MLKKSHESKIDAIFVHLTLVSFQDYQKVVLSCFWKIQFFKIIARNIGNRGSFSTLKAFY